MDDALDKLRQAAALLPGAFVYSEIGRVYVKQGKRAEALEALDTAIRFNPRFQPAYLYRGRPLRQLERMAGRCRRVPPGPWLWTLPTSVAGWAGGSGTPL